MSVVCLIVAVMFAFHIRMACLIVTVRVFFFSYARVQFTCASFRGAVRLVCVDHVLFYTNACERELRHNLFYTKAHAPESHDTLGIVAGLA